MFIILFIVSGLLPSPSVLHFTFPPTWCQLASLCNHTSIPECGKERDELHIRIFLDNCDMCEYNCDNHKDYNTIDILNCRPTTQSTTPTTTATQCTRPRNITSPMTKSTPSISTSTITCQTTPSTTVSNKTVTDTTMKTTLNQTESTITESLTTDSAPPTTEATTTESTTKEPMTVIPTIEETTTMVTTAIESTTLNSTIKINCTRNETTTLPTTKMTPTKEPNVTKQVTESLSTVTHTTVKETTMITTIEYEEVVATKHITEAKPTTTAPRPSILDCDNYPKDCNRPSTWATTAKGETRDFYLRAKFGNRVKLLRATTHWPRKYIPYDVDGTFRFGRHSET